MPFSTRYVSEIIIMTNLLKTSEQGAVPDFIIRRAIRALCRQRLKEIDLGGFEANHAEKMRWIEQVRQRGTIADLPEKANEQHYEVGLQLHGGTVSF